MRISGVVFNEMKGVYSQPDNVLGRTAQQACSSSSLLPPMTFFHSLLLKNYLSSLLLRNLSSIIHEFHFNYSLEMLYLLDNCPTPN